MRSVLFRLSLFIACVAALGSIGAHAQVNPHTNIKWPACTPPATVYSIPLNQCVPNGTGAGVGSAQGVAPVQVDGDSSGPHTGNILISCPTCGSGNFQMEYIPAASGQYALVYARTCGTNVGFCAPGRDSSGNAVFTGGGIGNFGFSNGVINWSDYTLPSYINPANVTAVYAFAVSSSNLALGSVLLDFDVSTGFSHTGDPCTAQVASPRSLAPFGGSYFPAGQTSCPLNIPPDFSLGNMHAEVCCNGQGTLDVYLIGLEVHYTGSAPPANSATLVQPPLIYNPATNVLGLSPAWPNFTYAQTIALLPASSGANINNIYPITDGIDGADCSAGGGSVVVFCQSTGSGYTAVTFSETDGITDLTGDVLATGPGSAAATVVPAARGFQKCLDTSGSGTAQACNTSPTFTPAANACVLYSTTTTNSGTGLTLDVNSLGAKSVAIPGASGWTTTLTAGIIPANKPLQVCYDGTNMNVVQTGSLSGSASLPLAAAAGQIISSAGAGTTYAAQGQIFYNQTGDTISSIESECSSPCTYVVTVPQTITLGASHTLNANVNLQFMAGGKWTVNGAFTLTIPGNVSGTLNTHFAGSSTIKFGDLEALVPFEWFGAIGDGSTDSTTAMQACLNALTAGQCLLQAETYVTSAALTITTSSVGIRGTSFGPGGSSAIASIIKSSSASADVVDVSGSGAIAYSAYQYFATDRSASATGTAAGLSFSNTCGLLVDNTQSFHSVRDYYFAGAAACGTGQISNNQAVTISGGYGFYIDSSALLPNSMRMNANTVSGTASYGFYFNGAPQDLMMDRSETAAETYGVYMDCSAGGGNNQDIHIRNSIIDAAVTGGIFLNSCSGVEIEGGWVSNGGSAATAIDVEGGAHVTIQTGLQILGPGWSQSAVYLNGVTQSAVQGINFLGNACGTCIKLNNSNNNTITDNAIGSNGYGIYLAGSSNNVVMANAIDVNNTFAGIFLDSSSNNNLYANLNQFKSGTSTPISDAGTGNQFSGASVTWPTTGDLVVSNGTNSPDGIPEVDGDCVLGVSGAWSHGSCAGGGGGGNYFNLAEVSGSTISGSGCTFSGGIVHMLLRSLGHH